MTFLYIFFAIFVYFLLLSVFRIIVLVLIMKVISRLKENIEKGINEKMESFKRGVKESE